LDKRLHFSHRSLYVVKEYNQSGEPGSQKSRAINVWLFYLELGDGTAKTPSIPKHLTPFHFPKKTCKPL
ncbi:hypothetical protein, partial [Leptospira yasudae]|uniref:hypothetical protein n=1 Tax=Leptospira yasudae TaxID=2202201 RepID=UPI001AEFE396